MKRLILTLLLVVVIAAAVLVLARNAVATFAITRTVESLMGLKADIGDMDIGLANSVVSAKDLRLYNPQGFSDPVMIDIPRIYIDYSLKALAGSKIYLSQLRLDLSEFLVVKNKQGELNIDSLKVVRAEKEKTEKKDPDAEQKARSQMPDIRVDELRLDVGKVIFKDYSVEGEPVTREFDIGIHETYRDITDPYALISLIVSKALIQTAIPAMVGLDMESLQGQAADILKSTEGSFKKSIEGAGEDIQKELKKILPFGDQ